MTEPEAPTRPAGLTHIPLFAFGASLSLFLAISYALCVLGYVLFPDALGEHAMLRLFMPWVNISILPGFVIGLAMSFAWGWYIALLFGVLFNFFAARRPV